MASFDELPVRQGYGPWHVNYFRVFIKPRPGKMPSGSELVALMPKVMDAHTAKVAVDTRHRWNGSETLAFNGVIRVGLPAFHILGHAVPESVRTFAPNTHHTDTVGLVFPATAHAFTVQTLKRKFDNGDDAFVRRLFQQRLAQETSKSLDDIARKLSKPVPGMLMLDPLRRMLQYFVEERAKESHQADQIITALAEFAIDFNRNHFLAGRRAFGMGTVKSFRLTEADYISAGLPRGSVDDLWVFETAAVERYSHRAFYEVTEKALGGDAKMLRPIWIEMCQAMAKAYGQMVGQVDVRQVNFGSRGTVVTSGLYKGIGNRHEALLPFDKRPGG